MLPANHSDELNVDVSDRSGEPGGVSPRILAIAVTSQKFSRGWRVRCRELASGLDCFPLLSLLYCR